MPYSTNAPFNNLGFTMALRDIEELSLKLQELNNYNNQAAGDLQPSGGNAVTQANPDDGWGKPSPTTSTPPAAGTTILTVWANTPFGIAAGTVGALICSTASGSLVSSYNTSTGAFTVPKTGMYLFHAMAETTISTLNTSNGLWLSRNGFQTNSLASLFYGTGFNQTGTLVTIATVPCQAGDIVYAMVSMAATGAVAAGEFSAIYLGAG